MRIDTAICFEVNFPDPIRHWTATGTDVLVFPSYAFVGDLLRWRHCRNTSGPAARRAGGGETTR